MERLVLLGHQAILVSEVLVLPASLEGLDSLDLLVPLAIQDTLVTLDCPEILEVLGFLELPDRKEQLEIPVLLVQPAVWVLPEHRARLVEVVNQEVLE